MKVRSQHGVRFVTGLALALSLAASACVGEVGDEEEIEATRTEPQTVALQETAPPPAPEARAPATRRHVEKATPTAIHRLDDGCRGPRNHCDPPPSPW